VYLQAAVGCEANMRALLFVILGLMVASILSIIVIKPFVTGTNQDSTVGQQTIEQPAPKP
jgi:hypothetical protein